MLYRSKSLRLISNYSKKLNSYICKQTVFSSLSSISRHCVKMSTCTSPSFHVDGLMCPPVTPMTATGDLNLTVIERYVDHLIEYGIKNVFLTGTIGEGNSLTVAERKQLLEAWVAAGKGRLSVIVAHIGCGNLKDSQELARHAQEVGATAISCVSPTYYKPHTIDDYVSYMALVASAAPALPFILYDIDFITGIKFSVEEFFERGKTRIPTLRGVKHTSPFFPSVCRVAHGFPDCQVLLGSEESYLEALAIGVDVTIISSYMGHILTRLKEAFVRGDLKAARIEQDRAIAINKVKNKYVSSYPAGCKLILQVLGFEFGQPRLPLALFSESAVESLRSDLNDIGYFTWGIHK